MEPGERKFIVVSCIWIYPRRMNTNEIGEEEEEMTILFNNNNGIYESSVSCHEL